MDDRVRVVVNELCYIDVVRRANPDVLLNGTSEGILTLRNALQRSSTPSNRWVGSRRRQRRHSWLLIQMLQRSAIHDRPHGLYTFLQNISTLTCCIVGIIELIPTKFNVLYWQCYANYTYRYIWTTFGRQLRLRLTIHDVWWMLI